MTFPEDKNAPLLPPLSSSKLTSPKPRPHSPVLFFLTHRVLIYRPCKTTERRDYARLFFFQRWVFRDFEVGLLPFSANLTSLSPCSSHFPQNLLFRNFSVFASSIPRTTRILLFYFVGAFSLLFAFRQILRKTLCFFDVTLASDFLQFHDFEETAKCPFSLGP